MCKFDFLPLFIRFSDAGDGSCSLIYRAIKPNSKLAIRDVIVICYLLCEAYANTQAGRQAGGPAYRSLNTTHEWEYMSKWTMIM